MASQARLEAYKPLVVFHFRLVSVEPVSDKRRALMQRAMALRSKCPENQVRPEFPKNLQIREGD